MQINQKKRAWFLASLFCVVAGGALITLTALNDHLLFFATPSDLNDKKFPAQKVIRVGGIVKQGSVSRSTDGLHLRFILTDHQACVSVQFKGIAPDLFREGQTIIAQGYLKPQPLDFPVEPLQFVATRLLAKHDENYQPKELQKKLPLVCSP